MPRKRNKGRDINGFLLLDKPLGLSSNQALQSVKRLFEAAKAGHTGSLDPLATGMLPICFGAATKVSSFLLNARKTYRVTGRLGIATDSGDAEGEIIAENDSKPCPDEVAVTDALATFQGDIEQIPPMYSALKHQGKRLYELARSGIEVERQARSVNISALHLVRYAWPELELMVTCSKGTYIRTLVEDIAKALGTVGHVTALRRTVVEPFAQEQMVSLAAVREMAEAGPASLKAVLLPVDSALTGWPRLVLQEDLCGDLSHGRAVEAEPDWPRSWVRLYSSEEVFFGIGEVRPHGQLVPRRIFPALSSWS